MTELLLQSGDKVRAALLKDGVLFRYEEEDLSNQGAEGIYRARVDRCMPALEAAFVRIGNGETAFLPYREMRGIKVPPRSGEEVLVQVKKSPAGQKQAYVTMDIALAGRGAVYLPLSERKTVSQSVTDDEARRELTARCIRLAPASGGLVLRREAQNMEDGALREEIAHLAARWQEILAAPRTDIGLLKGRERVWDRFYRDARPKVDKIFADFDVPGLPVERVQDPFSLRRVPEQVKKAWQRVHYLPCGGNVILEKTEALWVADVNSGKAVDQKKGLEMTAVRLNRQAAFEVARLCQVRNVGGILVVDFVDMAMEENRQAVEEALREAFREDPRKVVLHGFTALGLYEITRKKD